MKPETSVNPDYWRSLQVQVFDPAAFITAVHDKYADTNGCATMDALRRQWDATMAMPQEGDAKVCPYQPGVPRFALMEVWQKASDFWRAGYRPGDKLFSDQYGHALWPWMLDAIQGAPSDVAQAPGATVQREPAAVQLKLFF